MAVEVVPMARQRPPNKDSNNPVLTIRVTPECIQALDDLAETASKHAGHQVSRSTIAGELLVEAMKNPNVRAISAKERAAGKAASVLRSRLMAAVRAELEALEAEND
jgi:hypothetical protein